MVITSAGAVTLANSITSAALGDAVTVAGTDFNNMAGADAIDAPAGRWVVYSTDPANNAFGGLVSGNSAVWNTAYPNTVPSGNRYVFSLQPTVTVAADAQSRLYDATATAPALSSVVTGLVDASLYGDVFTHDSLSAACWRLPRPARMSAAMRLSRAHWLRPPAISSITRGTISISRRQA